MLNFKYSITDNISEDLKRKIKTLSDTEPLMLGVGNAVERSLKSHFDDLNKTPNQRGFHKTNFWTSIANHTHLGKTNKNSTEVIIADNRFNTHFYGGEIKPVKRKFLSIPLTDEAYGKRPKEINGLKLIRRKGKPSLLARVSRDGKKYNVRKKNQNEDYLSKKNAQIEAHFILLKKVYIPKKSDVLPSNDSVLTSVTETIEDYLEILDE